MIKIFIQIIITFILILLFFIIIYKLLLYKQFEKNKNINTFEIIISRYNEDLKWTLEEPFNKFRYTVYNKGVNDNFEKSLVNKIVNLNNVGREGHTYFFHIINNYNNLADINIFLPGSLNIWKKPIAKKLINYILKYNDAIFMSTYVNNNKILYNNFTMNKYIGFDKQNQIINKIDTVQLSTIRPYGKWFENKFGNLQIDTIELSGIFSINKKDIISKPISYYEQFLNELQVGPNPEVGHYIERAWSTIFYPLIYTKHIKNHFFYI